jgi:hypothetical protein
VDFGLRRNRIEQEEMIKKLKKELNGQKKCEAK